MTKRKHINVLSLAKLQTALGGCVGLFLGIVYAFGGLMIDVLVSSNLITSTETPGLSEGTALAFLALIGMPIIFAVAGLILGVIEALLYNIFAKWFGGIEIEL